MTDNDLFTLLPIVEAQVLVTMAQMGQLCNTIGYSFDSMIRVACTT